MESDRVTTKLIQGDCLKIMPALEPKSIDLVLCDLPYGTTDCTWDNIIPLEPLWERYNRIIKSRGVILLFGSEPFSTKLRSSNFNDYKYDLYWIKNTTTGFMNAKRMPLKNIELISVFTKATSTYNPQGVIEVNKQNKNSKRKFNTIVSNRRKRKKTYVQKYTNYPKMVIYFESATKTVHPTQKPVALLEYLIRTYSNGGDTVLDNCMGSGSTGVAAVNTGRNFVGIEKDENYFKIAQNRIAQAETLYETALFHCD